jgi:hypothetical protein
MQVHLNKYSLRCGWCVLSSVRTWTQVKDAGQEGQRVVRNRGQDKESSFHIQLLAEPPLSFFGCLWFLISAILLRLLF